LTLIPAGTAPSSPATSREGGSGEIKQASSGYGLPLDAPKTGAKRLDLLAGVFGGFYFHAETVLIEGSSYRIES
jgi:hypothetical protein